MANNLLDNLLESMFIDPVNTGANIVGASASIDSVEVSKKQLKLAEEARGFAIKNREYQEDIKELLSKILEQIIILNDK